MVSYCTVADVLSVAPSFRTDVSGGSGEGATYQPNTRIITSEEVEYLIAEASVVVRGHLKPRYDTAVIDAYGEGNYPPIVVYLTKLIAAQLMHQRYRSIDTENTMGIIVMLDRSVKQYRRHVVNGMLVDRTGERVPTINDPGLRSGENNDNFVTAGQLKELYESGREY